MTTKSKTSKEGKKAAKKGARGSSNNRENKTTVTTNKGEREVKLHSNLDGLKHPAEYLEFIAWIATPSALYDKLEMPKTQIELAKVLGVDKNVLSEWKKRAGFMQDVIEMRNLFFTDRASNVIFALETKCMNPQTVTGADARVYLTAVGQYQERKEEEHKVHPELQAALDKIGKVLK